MLISASNSKNEVNKFNVSAIVVREEEEEEEEGGLRGERAADAATNQR